MAAQRTPNHQPTHHELVERQALRGRVAGVLLIAGALFSLPAIRFLSDPDPAWTLHAVNGAAFASGLVCLLVPWRRLPLWTSHLVPPFAAAVVAAAVVAGGAHGSVFAWYFVLGGVYTGYTFRRTTHIVAHLGWVAACMLASGLLTLGDDPDALVRTVVGIPTVIAGAALIAYLRHGMEAGQHRLSELAEERRHEARTDLLTGLGNRRKLLDDLELALRPGKPVVTLVAFDLDGFKAYNDQFGHPAGDGLLARLGRRLADAVEGRGEAYRLGGDEFCVLIDRTGDEARPAIAAAAEALTERGESFEIGASQGACELPSEAGTPSGALQVADKRLYAHKHGRRGSPGQQAGDVLLSLLHARRPDQGPHRAEIAALARATARRLGLEHEDIDVTVRAAELHDIGKAAIPAHILHKTTPLTDEERGFVQRHTLVGEHILNAAQALRPVGRLVRASHERFDGSGYPDGLAGEDIPIGARIIAVCDAYLAMRSSERPYARAHSPAEAVAELRAHAGTQFDPAVVDAFVAELESPTASPTAPQVAVPTPGRRFASDLRA